MHTKLKFRRRNQQKSKATIPVRTPEKGLAPDLKTVTLPGNEKEKEKENENENEKEEHTEILSSDEETDSISNPSYVRKLSSHKRRSKEKQKKQNQPSLPPPKKKMIVEKPAYTLTSSDDDYDDDDNSYSSDEDSFAEPQPQKPSKEEEDREKMEIIANFHRLRQKGIKIKNYTMKSNLQEMRMEYGRIIHEQEVKQSVETHKKLLMRFTSGLEIATNHKRFAPQFLHNKLTGYSKWTRQNLDEYNDVFEKMSEEPNWVSDFILQSNAAPTLQLALIMFTQLMGFMLLNYEMGDKEMTTEEVMNKHPEAVRKAAEEIAKEAAQDLEQKYKYHEMQMRYDMERQKNQIQQNFMNYQRQQQNNPPPSMKIPEKMEPEKPRLMTKNIEIPANRRSKIKYVQPENKTIITKK
jgi:hypothetical protein